MFILSGSTAIAYARNLPDNARVTEGTGIIQRAFQLAENSGNLDEIRAKLKSEGYTNVDAHLSGGSIRADLKRIFKKHSGDWLDDTDQ